ncbi:MAG: DUF4339 domain-containing protein [Bacteroidetes bacterium]|nr:DUF4339 domain-containing protein [Bacteroidota bacterium]MBL7104439.1 DUF4339 domain-containing protein [Bacteroidales bacterium]
MKKYYLHNGTEQEGPFDIEDLKTKNLTKNTQVWYEGLSDWITADKIEELKDLFKLTSPPPFNEKKKKTPPPLQKSKPEQTNSSTKPKKKSKVGKIIIIIVIVLAVIIGGLAILDNLNHSGSGSGSESYYEKVMTVEEIEQSQPTKFLDADGNYNENFWGDKINVHGKITNSATVATYKDATIRVTYYSKTETVLGSDDYTIYEVFPPNSVKKFELKIENYKNVNSIGWDVINAKVY